MWIKILHSTFLCPRGNITNCLYSSQRNIKAEQLLSRKCAKELLNRKLLFRLLLVSINLSPIHSIRKKWLTSKRKLFLYKKYFLYHLLKIIHGYSLRLTIRVKLSVDGDDFLMSKFGLSLVRIQKFTFWC